ncbi:Uncharacterized protein PBTT_10239 [Plasmodiophora brassicae]
MATALDPRMESFLKVLGIEHLQVMPALVDEFTLRHRAPYEAKFASHIVADGATANPEASSFEATAAMDSLLTLFKPNEATQPPGRSESSSESFENELQRWFSHQGMSVEQSSRDVCKWFKVNQQLIPWVAMWRVTSWG